MAQAAALGWKVFTDLMRPAPSQALVTADREADHTIEMLKRVTERMKNNG